MKLTELQKSHDNFSIRAYINNNGKGFVLGGDAKVIPSEYKEAHSNNELEVLPVNDGSFSRVIDRTNVASLKNMKPAYARVTESGSLIIE